MSSPACIAAVPPLPPSVAAPVRASPPRVFQRIPPSSGRSLPPPPPPPPPSSPPPQPASTKPPRMTAMHNIDFIRNIELSPFSEKQTCPFCERKEDSTKLTNVK